jgi:CII-binding regulator of phage lambda lysogenization HflD
MNATTESELATIMLAIGRLEGKVDSLLGRQDELQQAIQRLETRVHDIEGMKHKMLGAAAIIGAIVSLGMRFVKIGP